MSDIDLERILRTLHEDKAKVLKGLREQNQDIIYTTTEVTAMLQLVFALVEASIMSATEEKKNGNKPTLSSRSQPQERKL